jgi:nitrate/nitrite transport system substrate-binding protein
MASAGIDPDREVRLTVVPPPQMVNYLRAGVISGYCVGEPWNAHAVNADLGRVVATSHAIWNNHPEKVFGVSRAWAQANPNTHQAVLMALMEAAAWLDEPDNRIAACAILSKGRYVNAPEDVLRMSLTGTYQFGAQEPPRAVADFNVFHRYAANYPWVSHGVWTLSQMVRWGQIDRPVDLLQIAREVYKPRLYRQAAEALGWPIPAADTKLEGEHDAPWTLEAEGGPIAMGPDRFMDGGRFDARDVAGYLARFEIASLKLSLDELRAATVQAVA